VSFRASFEGPWRGPDGVLIPNWREQLRCPQCGFNGRQRMVAKLIVEWVMELPSREAISAYMMEQSSPLYEWATRTFPWIAWTGSEYLGADRVAGSTKRGIRHEDAEALSFGDATFDLVVSCDVFEHVNDPMRAFGEVARVLRPGGTMIATFPMDPMLATNRRRAILDDGELRHLLPPIYHDSPTGRGDALVFTDFGWEVLRQLRDAGLPDAMLTVYWSYEFGYLGIQFHFTGSRPR
jgi:SAM-dependent methyltransferase